MGHASSQQNTPSQHTRTHTQKPSWKLKFFIKLFNTVRAALACMQQLCRHTPIMFFSLSSTVATCYKHNWKHLEQMGLGFQTKHKPHALYYSTKSFVSLPACWHSPPLPVHQHSQAVQRTCMCATAPAHPAAPAQTPISSLFFLLQIWQCTVQKCTAAANEQSHHIGREGEEGKGRRGANSSAQCRGFTRC